MVSRRRSLKKIETAAKEQLAKSAAEGVKNVNDKNWVTKINADFWETKPKKGALEKMREFGEKVLGKLVGPW